MPGPVNLKDSYNFYMDIEHELHTVSIYGMIYI